MSDDLNQYPGINAALIKRYVDENDLDNLLAIFDFLRRSTLRAETLSQVYLNQITVLQKRLNAARAADTEVIREPRAKRIVEPTEPKTSAPRVAKKPKEPEGDILEIEF